MHSRWLSFLSNAALYYTLVWLLVLYVVKGVVLADSLCSLNLVCFGSYNLSLTSKAYLLQFILDQGRASSLVQLPVHS